MKVCIPLNKHPLYKCEFYVSARRIMYGNMVLTFTSIDLGRKTSNQVKQNNEANYLLENCCRFVTAIAADHEPTILH